MVRISPAAAPAIDALRALVQQRAERGDVRTIAGASRAAIVNVIWDPDTETEEDEPIDDWQEWGATPSSPVCVAAGS